MSEYLENSEMDVVLDRADESMIILGALRDTYGTDEEYATAIESAAVEMALYDVIGDADAAMEAAKKIVVQDFKAAKFNRIVYSTALRMAAKEGDPNYKMYRNYRKKALEAREKVYKKYLPRAKAEAKKIIRNARNRSSDMTSVQGKDLAKRMDNIVKDSGAAATTGKPKV